MCFGESTPEWFTPGAQIGQYEIIRKLGSGGMGVVFLARDTRLGRRVAIKFFRTANRDATRRFIAEARATAQCNHENIVVLHEVSEIGGSPFLVFEYLEGETLASMIRKDAPLRTGRAVELAMSIVRALACAHEQGIVHRDLKPQNVLLTSAGRVKVLDFGLAKLIDPGGQAGDTNTPASGVGPVRQAGAGSVERSEKVGTLTYMSPEQWGVGGPIDHRTDLWATGLILFHMLAGWHPLERLGSEARSWVADLDEAMPSLLEAAPQVPAELARVVDACLRKRKEERISDAHALLRAIEPFLPGRQATPQVPVKKGPYAGLRAFGEDDAGCFFGRGLEISVLVGRLHRWPLLAVVGPSGIGKSSLVRAGVIPALKNSGEDWDALIVRPGRNPVLALASALLQHGRNATAAEVSTGAQDELTSRLLAEPGYLGRTLRNIARRTGRRCLIFVDQFEELYTLCADAAARRVFTSCLAAAADDPATPLRVIVSIRADFLGRVSEDAYFLDQLSRGLYFLGPLSPEGLRDSVVRPAEMAGYRFETSATIEDMMQHLESTPGALPLLQFTALQLWEARDASRGLLTEESYRAIGGIAGALVSHADRVMASIPPKQRALCRTLLLNLVTPERTRAVRNRDELLETAQDPHELQRLLDRLVESRLLVVQDSSAAVTVEIVHESLIASWPRLQRWLDESHEDSALLDLLRPAARQWQAKGRDSGLLWGGEAVEDLRRFQNRFRGTLPEPVRAFVTAVLEREARRARRTYRLLTTGIVCAGAILLAAVVALTQIDRETRRALDATAEAIRAKAGAMHAAQEAKLAEEKARDAEKLAYAAQQSEQHTLRELQEAEAQRRAAEKKAASATKQIGTTNVKLAVADSERREALEQARVEQEQAQEARAQAEQSARAAREAEAKERARRERLLQQLGSEPVEELR